MDVYKEAIAIAVMNGEGKLRCRKIFLAFRQGEVFFT